MVRRNAGEGPGGASERGVEAGLPAWRKRPCKLLELGVLD